MRDDRAAYVVGLQQGARRHPTSFPASLDGP